MSSGGRARAEPVGLIANGRLVGYAGLRTDRSVQKVIAAAMKIAECQEGEER